MNSFIKLVLLYQVAQLVDVQWRSWSLQWRRRRY